MHPEDTHGVKDTSNVLLKNSLFFFFGGGGDGRHLSPAVKRNEMEIGKI